MHGAVREEKVAASAGHSFRKSVRGQEVKGKGRRKNSEKPAEAKQGLPNWRGARNTQQRSVNGCLLTGSEATMQMRCVGQHKTRLPDLWEPRLQGWAGTVWIRFPKGTFQTNEKAAERPCQGCKAGSHSLNRAQTKASRRTRRAEEKEGRARGVKNTQHRGEC